MWEPNKFWGTIDFGLVTNIILNICFCVQQNSKMYTRSEQLDNYSHSRYDSIPQNFCLDMMRFVYVGDFQVACGGCHMLVLARPRDEGSENVILEEDDVTEDYFEKSYTELMGDTHSQTTLNRSLSARVRRRERVGSSNNIMLCIWCL